ncbi:MAG: FAD binding domain-containing protein [Thermoanaerobaculia bacterium]
MRARLPDRGVDSRPFLEGSLRSRSCEAVRSVLSRGPLSFAAARPARGSASVSPASLPRGRFVRTGSCPRAGLPGRPAAGSSSGLRRGLVHCREFTTRSTAESSRAFIAFREDFEALALARRRRRTEDLDRVRSPISSLSLLEPKSLREALLMLRDEEPLTPLAGCTDVYVSLNFGTLRDRRFLNLWPLDALRGIRLRGSTLSIGALTTYTELQRSPLVRRRLPMLAAAAHEVGGVQIQNRGTIGGNVVNASPAGDALPVLAAAEAILVLTSAGSRRRVPFDAFYTGYRKTVLRRDELLLSIEIPEISGRQHFRKVGTRAAQAISKVVMAAVFGPSVRIALGSVAPTVIRARRTEELLASGGSIADARRSLGEEIAPIDDLRSTADYRRRVCANVLERFWRQRT